MAVIKVAGFTKCYGDFLAVDNISFSINEGEITGFVGKNGAGKTTTIRSLLNIINPSSGELSIFDLDCNKDSKEIKTFTSYMPSDSKFYDNLSALDIFKLVSELVDVDISKAIEYSEYFDLDINKKIKELSFGNLKKVSIIQALIKANKLLILDEPTNGLDPLMQSKFFDLILKLKNEGLTIFLSSHNLSEIEKYCDRVLIIKDGKLVDDLDMKKERLNRKKLVTYESELGEKMAYHYEGDINDLIDNLSKLKLKSLEIKDLSIEEEFMKYYEGESDYEKY